MGGLFFADVKSVKNQPAYSVDSQGKIIEATIALMQENVYIVKCLLPLGNTGR